MIDLVVRGGTVVTGFGSFEGGVGVDGGKIVALGRDDRLPRARRTIDAAGRFILPGLVDPHTHPGNYRSFDEDVRSETRAAAVGGVTTMLGTVKSTRMGGPFKEETFPEDVCSYLDVGPGAVRAIEQEAFVDVGLSFMVMTRQHAEEIAPCIETLGVTSFKFFAGSQGESPWGRRVGMPVFPDEGTLYLGFEQCAQHGALAMIHAENRQAAAVRTERLQRSEIEADLRTWERHSPGDLEASEIHAWSYFARHLGTRLYVVHLTSAAGLAEVQAARSLGTRLIAETCPQYLVLGAEDGGGQRALSKFSPPVRYEEDRNALWDGLSRGAIDCVGTDHFAPLREWKLKPGDVWGVLPGGPGMGTLLPLLVTEGVRKGRFDWDRLVQLTATNPARAFGLYPRKGTFVIGADADIVVVDGERERRVDPAALGGFADFSPYEDRTLTGWPVMTILRGNVIAHEGQVVGKPQGRYLRRGTPSAVANT